MVKNKKIFVFIMVMLLTLLGACSANIDDEQIKAEQLAKESFTSDSKETNTDTEYFSLYVPSAMKLDDTDPNNILITEGEELYLLFINQNEGQASKVIYESTLNSAENFRLNKTFENENQFGYILIKDNSEKEYELTIGVGGVKMSTVTDASNIAENAQTMMEIVNSIQFDSVK